MYRKTKCIIETANKQIYQCDANKFKKKPEKKTLQNDDVSR